MTHPPERALSLKTGKERPILAFTSYQVPFTSCYLRKNASAKRTVLLYGWHLAEAVGYIANSVPIRGHSAANYSATKPH